MKRWTPLIAILFALIPSSIPRTASAQSTPTASRAFEPSVFGGITGTFTGLNGARNAAITLGADMGFHPYFHLLPAVEVRGTLPIDSGNVVGEKSILAGLRLEKRYGRFHPYADFLVGRGQLNYQSGGYVVILQDFRYIQSTTNVFSPGLGFEQDLTPHFALRLDGQLQRWAVPFDPTGATDATNGAIWSKVGTIGVVYRFGWLQHGHPAP